MVNNVQGLVLDGLSARQATNGTDAPAVLLNGVMGAVVATARLRQAQARF